MKKWLLVPLVVLCIAFLFLPKLASTPFFKPYFLKAFEKKTDTVSTIDHFQFSWFGPQKFQGVQWKKGDVSGTAEEFAIKAPFWSFSGPFTLKNGSLSYQGKTIQPINAEIEGENFTLRSESVNAEGKFVSKEHFDITANVKNFPLAIFGYQEILGATIDLKGRVAIVSGKGNVDMYITTPNLQTHVVGNLSPHSLLLTKPLDARFLITSAATNGLMQSRQEGKLQLNERSEIPIPFSIEKFSGAGLLDLNRVQIKGDESISSLTSLLKANSKSRSTNIWFAPVNFQVTSSMLDLGRVDFLLADSIHLCAWGRVDLSQNKLHMYLGLPAETLMQSFGIKKLSPNYVMKVQLRGTIDHPEIVTGPVATKIAALIAAEQLLPKKGVLGGIIGIVTTPKEDKDIPPAKRPFPWERR